MRFDGKTAVVTGAASGIGEAVARMLAVNGVARLAVVDNAVRIDEVARNLNDAMGRSIAVAFRGDVCDSAFRAACFDALCQDGPPPSLCVPAAGITRDALAVKLDKATGRAAIYPQDVFQKVLDVNLTAPVYWALEMIARIAEDRHRGGTGRWEPTEPISGAIVLIGSVSSRGNRGQVSYAASKAALAAVAATLSSEGIHYGVRCAVVHPGFTDTPMVRAMGTRVLDEQVLPRTQLRRLIRPEEIAEAIGFLLANPAVSGPLWVDAGWQPAP
ncbi:MAG: SDR family NAD(P)-dependent oxidoreductase [Planctomycetota bacterium]